MTSLARRGRLRSGEDGRWSTRGLWLFSLDELWEGRLDHPGAEPADHEYDFEADADPNGLIHSNKSKWEAEFTEAD